VSASGASWSRLGREAQGSIDAALAAFVTNLP
jgi:hypothetical protein